MSTLRSRLRRLASLAADPRPEPVVLHLEVFGDDDHGGGRRDRGRCNLRDVVAEMVDGPTVIVRPVVFAEDRG